MLIKNGIIVTESDSYKSDILIKNGIIDKIGIDISSDEEEIIDATGKYIFPGGVDVHTHMDLQAGKVRAVDDFYSGTYAAVYGGTTTIIDHIAFGPEGCNLNYQIDEYHILAKDKAVVDYSFHGVIQHVNENILKEMEELVEKGISSFKIYMTYDFKLSDGDILKVLKKAKKLGIIIAVHAENDSLIDTLRKEDKESGRVTPIYHAKSRPNLVEAEAIDRVLKIAKLAGDAPIYIVHLSTAEGLEEIVKARKNGQKNIFVETCPQYLVLTEGEYLQENYEGLKYIMSPPLREKKDNEELWEAIKKGEIQVVATDHCPFNIGKEKKFGKDNYQMCPNGAPGVEERMEIIFNEGVIKNRISINKFVEVTSTNPAKIYGCYPRKGVLLPGSDADIIIMNPKAKKIIKKEENLHSSVDYSLYEGKELEASIELVIKSGKIVIKGKDFFGEKDGRFIKRKKSFYL